MPSNANARPLVITWLGWLLITFGAVEFVYHLTKIHKFLGGDIAVPLFELIILVSGIFLLRGSNWARWLAVAWIGFHIAVGFLDSFHRGIVHTIVFLIFLWLLFRPEVNAWFRPEREPAA